MSLLGGSAKCLLLRRVNAQTFDTRYAARDPGSPLKASGLYPAGNRERSTAPDLQSLPQKLRTDISHRISTPSQECVDAVAVRRKVESLMLPAHWRSRLQSFSGDAYQSQSNTQRLHRLHGNTERTPESRDSCSKCSVMLTCGCQGLR